MNILETGSRPGKCTKCGHEVPESSGSTRSAWKGAGVHGGTGIELLVWFGHKCFCMGLCRQNW